MVSATLRQGAACALDCQVSRYLPDVGINQADNLRRCFSSKEHFAFREPLIVTSVEMDLVERCQNYLADKEPETVEVRATALRELATIRLQRLLRDENYFEQNFGQAA